MNAYDRLTFLDGFLRALDAADMISSTARIELMEDLRDIRAELIATNRQLDAARAESNALRAELEAIPLPLCEVNVTPKAKGTHEEWDRTDKVRDWLNARAPKAEAVLTPAAAVAEKGE